jgi:hypothetical protein
MVPHNLHAVGVTTTLCHAEAQLLKRNEKLEDLRLIDNELRELHAAQEWRECASLRNAIGRMANNRQLLSLEITEMGASPWCFNLKRDNSWLAYDRKELVGQGTGRLTIEACASTPNSDE